MRRVSGIIKTLIVIGVSIALTSFTINATDNLGNFSDSALGAIVVGIFGEEERCPKDMVLVDSATGGFCIDIYEASPGEDCVYDNPSSQVETRNNMVNPKCVPASEPDRTPWRNVSQTQAISLCAKAGKRLPTNEEWYAAAIGTPDTSEGWDDGSCNVMRNWSVSEPGKTGSAPECVSYYGTYDMVGNVWEWVRDTVKQGEYQGTQVPDSGFVHSVDETGIPTMTDRSKPDPNYNDDRFWSEKTQVVGIFRGGYWASGSGAGIYTAHAQMPPSFVGVGVGFRCVK